ncbi:MAG: superoxide dismutase family protein [Flavobacteriaceae bacterium]|nr:superoxide dismutase family protein [Flavobacteriaceae bacterium]
MKLFSLLSMLLILTTTMSCKNENKKDDVDDQDEMVIQTKNEDMKESATPMKEVSMELESRSESNAVGKVVFTEENGMVKMEARISGLTPGTHAIHIHEEADCSAADATSSGGHWNPTHEPHGKWGDEGGYHKGDIGNFEADADGNGMVSMETDQWCIGCDDDTKNILGKAIIVHKGADDFTSQPSGAAGARVSCGGIIQ